jgi:hypothetical protein
MVIGFRKEIFGNMALKRYCDMCGIETDAGRYLTIKIVANRKDIRGSMG